MIVTWIKADKGTSGFGWGGAHGAEEAWQASTVKEVDGAGFNSSDDIIRLEKQPKFEKIARFVGRYSPIDSSRDARSPPIVLPTALANVLSLLITPHAQHEADGPGLSQTVQARIPDSCHGQGEYKPHRPTRITVTSLVPRRFLALGRQWI